MKITITIDVPDDPNNPQVRALEENCVLETIESALVESGASFEWEDDTSTLVTKDDLFRFLYLDSGIFDSTSNARRATEILDAHFTLHRR